LSSGGDELPGQPDPALALPPEEFLESLEPFELVLLEVKEKLYEGSWSSMEVDLKARLKGEPYIFKLSQTINRDLAALRKLKAYEATHGVDLSTFSS